MEIDVSRRVDQIEFVKFAAKPVFHPHRPGLDRDSPLPLQLHVVEHLLFELTFFNGACAFQQPVCQRAFAVVDVGDDREVADVLTVNGHDDESTEKNRCVCQNTITMRFGGVLAWPSRLPQWIQHRRRGSRSG